MTKNTKKNKDFVPPIKRGQRIKVISNHMYAGHCGTIEDVENMDKLACVFNNQGSIHVKLDDGNRITLREGQYKTV